MPCSTQYVYINIGKPTSYLLGMPHLLQLPWLPLPALARQGPLLGQGSPPAPQQRTQQAGRPPSAPVKVALAQRAAAPPLAVAALPHVGALPPPQVASVSAAVVVVVQAVQPSVRGGRMPL
jgi:hypothetical protein